MKFQISKYLLLASAVLMASCSSDEPSTPDTEFSAVYELNQVTHVGLTTGDVCNVIQVGLTDGVYSLSIAFGVTGDVLTAGEYTFKSSDPDAFAASATAGAFAAKLSARGRVIDLSSSTKATVSVAAGNYDIVLTSTVGKDRIKAHYNGSIEVAAGPAIEVADASGYTAIIVEGDVVDANNNVVSGVTKYSIMVADPDGRDVAQFDAVNRSGLSIADLVGTYTLTSYPSENWTMDNGWVVYYPGVIAMSGGTWFADAKGNPMYVTQGKITIEAAIDREGNPLYTFKGEGLTTITETNAAGTETTVELPHAQMLTIGGQILNDESHQSKVMGMEMTYSVYLPQSWDGVKTFPVVYMLHGAGGNNKDWMDQGLFGLKLASAIARGQAPEMIVIMPNCTVNGRDFFYCNNYQGDFQYMTYFFDEFLPMVEAKYKVQGDREHRMIGGLSMGGFGSLYYGSLHPEMFSYVYACSPATYFDGVPNIYELYGNDLAAGIKIPGMTIEIGTSDFLYDSAKFFKGYLDGVGIPCDWIERDGAHDWKFWLACTPKIISKAASLFR